MLSLYMIIRRLLSSIILVSSNWIKRPRGPLLPFSDPLDRAQMFASESTVT